MEIGGEEVLFTITCVSNTSIKYLHIIWNKLMPFFAFCSDKELRHIIHDNYKLLYNEHFDHIFGRLDESNYYINIASDEDYGMFEWNKQTGHLVEQQIMTYKPLIQQFILDTKTYPHIPQ